MLGSLVLVGSLREGPLANAPAAGDSAREAAVAARDVAWKVAAVLGPLVPCEGLVANAQAGDAWEVAEVLGPLVCEGLLANA